jgi:hypothetical protein
MTLKQRIEMRADYFLNTAWGMNYAPGFIWKKLEEEFGSDQVRANYRVYRKAKETYEKWNQGIERAPKPKGWKKAQQYGEFY